MICGPAYIIYTLFLYIISHKLVFTATSSQRLLLHKLPQQEMEDYSGPGKSPEGSREVYKLVARDSESLGDSETQRELQRPKINTHENKSLGDKSLQCLDLVPLDLVPLDLYHDKGSSKPSNSTKLDNFDNSPDNSPDDSPDDSTQNDSAKLTKSPQTNSPDLNSSSHPHEDDSSDPLELHKLSLSYDYLIYKINDHIALLSETTHQSILRKQELITTDYLQDQLQLAKEFKEIDEILEKCRNLELDFLKLDQLGGFIGEFKERVTQLERVFKELG